MIKKEMLQKVSRQVLSNLALQIQNGTFDNNAVLASVVGGFYPRGLKINLIKLIRSVCNSGLGETKDFVEGNAPLLIVSEGDSPDNARSNMLLSAEHRFSVLYEIYRLHGEEVTRLNSPLSRFGTSLMDPPAMLPRKGVISKTIMDRLNDEELIDFAVGIQENKSYIALTTPLNDAEGVDTVLKNPFSFKRIALIHLLAGLINADTDSTASIYPFLAGKITEIDPEMCGEFEMDLLKRIFDLTNLSMVKSICEQPPQEAVSEDQTPF